MQLVPMTTTAVVAVRSEEWFTPEEHAAVEGFLAGYSGLTREAYELDPRQYVGWCAEHRIALFGPRRVDIESFGRHLETLGRARATLARPLCTIVCFYRYHKRPVRGHRRSATRSTKRHVSKPAHPADARSLRRRSSNGSPPTTQPHSTLTRVTSSTRNSPISTPQPKKLGETPPTLRCSTSQSLVAWLPDGRVACIREHPECIDAYRNSGVAASTANSRHSSGTPLRMWLPWSESDDPGPDEKSFHGLGDEHLCRSGEVADTFGDRDREPGDVVASEFDLAGMKPGPDVQSQRFGSDDDLRRAANGVRATVEGGEEPVAHRLDLATAVALEGGPDEGVVVVGQLAPRPRPQPGSLRSRVDNVGEQDRCQCHVAFGSLVAAGEELLDLVDERVAVTREEEVIIAGECDELGAVDVLGQVAAGTDMDVAVSLVDAARASGRESKKVMAVRRARNWPGSRRRFRSGPTPSRSVPCPPLSEPVISDPTGSEGLARWRQCPSVP